MPLHNTLMVHVTGALLAMMFAHWSSWETALIFKHISTHGCVGPPVSNYVLFWVLSCLESSCGDDADKVCRNRQLGVTSGKILC